MMTELNELMQSFSKCGPGTSSLELVRNADSRVHLSPPGWDPLEVGLSNLLAQTLR